MKDNEIPKIIPMQNWQFEKETDKEQPKNFFNNNSKKDFNFVIDAEKEQKETIESCGITEVANHIVAERHKRELQFFCETIINIYNGIYGDYDNYLEYMALIQKLAKENTKTYYDPKTMSLSLSITIEPIIIERDLFNYIRDYHKL